MSIRKKLEPATVSICNRCVVDGTFDDDGTGTDGNEEYDGDEDEPNIVEKEVRDDNQVVPWSSTPPPPASSSSSNEEFWSVRMLQIVRSSANKAPETVVYGDGTGRRLRWQ
ncbi:hypothetical protein L1887_25553 [Cichorium endivia]|nr:hypothetical protein L1887_25553 [Cichorium endivia]